MSNRLTVNAGLRYDLVTGFAIDQSQIPNYQILTSAAAAGRFNGVPGWDEFEEEKGEDKNNIQPRIGAVFDLRGDGRDVIRAGWGIYYDYGYTNATILFPGLSAQGGSGVVFTATDTAGLRNPDGSFFRVGQPVLPNLAAENEVDPNGPFYSTQLTPPQIRQPWTSQFSLGWSHELTPSTVLDVDFVDARGRDLGVRWPLNTRVNGGDRRFADLNLNPANPTLNMSVGRSTYQGINFGVRRRMDHGIQLSALVLAGESQGAGRPVAGRADDEPGAGCVRPLRRRPVGSVDAVRCPPQGHGQCDHPGTMGYHGVPHLPVPVGAADDDLDRLRRECRWGQQRHLHHRLQVHGRGRSGEPVIRRDGAVRNGQLRARSLRSAS